MAVLLEQRPTISEGDVDFLAVDCTPQLDGDETVSSVSIIEKYKVTAWVDDVPTLVTTTDLTVDNETPTIAAQIILRRTVAIAKGIQFRVTGQLAPLQYVVLFKIVTSKGRQKRYGAVITVAA